MEEDMELCSLASDEGLPCCDVISSASHESVPGREPYGMGIQAAAVVRFLQGDFAGFFLKEHQKEGAKFLLQQISGKPPAGAILADHMGLGKTATVLVCALFMLQHFAWRTCVVCPKSLVAQWNAEIARWCGKLHKQNLHLRDRRLVFQCCLCEFSWPLNPKP